MRTHRRARPSSTSTAENALPIDAPFRRRDFSNLPPRLVALVVLGISAAYVAMHLDRGWVPLDEGALAHAAQRVLLGELPHRDFDDVYTGGLAWLNAAAFELFGPTLWSMRLALFGAFLLWVPTVHYVASRFARPLTAAGVTLVAVVWSVPNYPAPMPSWYNLFLALFGVAALLRHLEDGRLRWLFAAGVAGGISFLVKIVGLYYVAGVLLFLVFHAHDTARRSADGAGEGPGRSVGYATFVTLALLLFVVALLLVVRGRLAAPELVHFVLPSGALAALLIHREWTRPAGDARTRLRLLSRFLTPFLLGVLLPVALLLLPYARTGALDAFVHGVFVLPARRLGHASFALPLTSLVALVPAALIGLALVSTSAGRGRLAPSGRALALAALLLGAILYASGSHGAPYRLVLFSLRSLLPVMAIVTVALLVRDGDDGELAALRRSRLVLLLSVTSVCALVQFPFTVAIYFCYIAPLVLLSVAALLGYLNRWRSDASAALAIAFCAAFAVLRLNASPLNDMDRQYEPYPEVRRLQLDRAGLTVPLFQAGQYESVVRIVREHARGEYIWASPDAPQVYFLTGYRNPTRSLFEFFDDTTGRSSRILRMLDEREVNLVVLNIKPEFSPRIPMALYRELAKRYPNSALAEPFLIKWRE